MIVGIKDICLYTGLTPTGGNDSAKALAWLRENNIPHRHLWYSEPERHHAIFQSLNSQRIGEFSDFPFVIYDELHDDSKVERRAIIGLDAILNSNLAELVELSSQ